MRTILTCAALAFTAPLLPVDAADLGAAYAPTRAEWLQVELSRVLSSWTGTWDRRLTASVAVFTGDGAIVVTLAAANGQTQPRAEVQARYIEAVKEMTQGVLKRYDWAKDLKLTVQFA